MQPLVTFTALFQAINQTTNILQEIAKKEVEISNAFLVVAHVFVLGLQVVQLADSGERRLSHIQGSHRSSP